MLNEPPETQRSMNVIGSFQVFGQTFMVTRGGPELSTRVLVQYIYENGFVSPIRYGIAAAGGVILFGAVFTLTLINWFISRRRGAE